MRKKLPISREPYILVTELTHNSEINFRIREGFISDDVHDQTFPVRQSPGSMGGTHYCCCEGHKERGGNRKWKWNWEVEDKSMSI